MEWRWLADMAVAQKASSTTEAAQGVESSESHYLAQLRNQHVARGIASTTPLFAARGRSADLWDVDGNHYLDFSSGISVLNVGHSHPRVVAAVQTQLNQFLHTCFQVVMYESYVRVAERLNHIAPGNFEKKSLLVTTGAEAIENAVKIARAYTSRPAVLAFHGGFHGRTLFGLSLTGKERPYRFGFGPFASEVYHGPYPYEYRGWTAKRALEVLQELFVTEVDPTRVAAVIIEPVLGEGGFVPAPAQFLQALRKICDTHGILLVADEIQTGFGRTGRWFAIEHSDVVPDLITVAKTLGGGLPLAAVTGRAEVMDAPMPGGLGGTYAGNPLACAAALAVFRILEEDNLLDRAEVIGARIRIGLQRLAHKHHQIGDIRGLGAMIGIELVSNRRTKTPAPALTTAILHEALRRNLILIKAGVYDNVVRLLPPLTVTDDQVDQALRIIEESVVAATRS